MVVIVNTDKSETFEETGAGKLEDDDESDEKEGEDGRGVDVAGEGGVVRFAFFVEGWLVVSVSGFKIVGGAAIIGYWFTVVTDFCFIN